ncbi:MAG TPA: M20 family metallopeptidase [Acholeplasmataceae bacterium]|nr:M20 family metallopeptidase [Acholeplasmataceae bacterium]
MLVKELFEKLDQKYEKMVEIRRHLHMYPELSFEEKETSKYIAGFYKNKWVEVKTNVGGYGVVVTIDTKKPGKTIALRADFDALPIEEENTFEYRSKNPGVMHSCAHDGHTAYLMVLAQTLIEMKDKLVGKIVIIHQPAEETPPGGSIQMIKDGVLEGVDNVFGLHLMSQMDFGKIFYHKGETQQARAKFDIKIQGVGGHGSSPHEANDAIVCASYMVTALQTIISRRLNPFMSGVVTIGSFTGEGSFNIIKDSVTLTGDVRTMSEKAKVMIEEEVNRIAKGIGEAFNCGIEVDYKNDYPVLYNDPELTQFVVDTLEKVKIDNVIAVEDSGPMAPSEDFSYYTKERPCVFYYIGAKPQGEAYPHHHPKFDFDERAMLIAGKSLGAVVLSYFNLLK